MVKCIVLGCNNHKHEGQFVGDLCAPCHHYITTGQIGPTSSFLGKISKKANLGLSVLDLVKTEFKAKLQVKTGWGKNELWEVYLEAEANALKKYLEKL